jgi:E3 ubiquitin-protein ligase makorin
MCRAHSDYIIPSSQFPVSPSQGEENTAKKAIVDRYLSRLQNIPCRYFEQSVEDTMPDFRPKCKFGNSCHYAHRHPLSKEPYIFSEEEINRSRRRRRPRQPRYDPAVELAVMESLIAGLSFYDSDDLLDDMGCEFDDDLALFESGDLGFSFGAEVDFEEDEFEGYFWD